MQWSGKSLIVKANSENVSRETSPRRFRLRTEGRSIYQPRNAGRNQRQPSSVGGRLGLSARIYQQRRQVGENASGDQNRAEEKSVHAENGFLLAEDDRQDEQKQRKNSQKDRAGHSSGYTEGPHKFWFTDAQKNQCQKFEDQAEAGNEDVEGHQPFESDAQAQRPTRCQKENRHPGRSGLRMHPSENFRQHAVLRHRQRKPRVAHHQRV